MFFWWQRTLSDGLQTLAGFAQALKPCRLCVAVPNSLKLALHVDESMFQSTVLGK